MLDPHAASDDPVDSALTPWSLGARLIPGSAATALPLLIANPDIAITGFEWIELIGGIIGLTALAWFAGGAIARAAGVSHRRGRIVGGLAAWVGLLSLAGFASAGWLGAGTVISVSALASGASLLVRTSVSGFARSMGVVGAAWISAVAVTSAFAATGETPDRSLVVIGLDGASWPLIDRFRREGRLPTLDAWSEEGARGDLDTVRPLLSPALWTSVTSGLPPADHGVRDFWTSARHVRVKRVWEMAAESGQRVGVFGFLVTWPPPSEGFEFFVPGFLAQDDQTTPPELAFVKQIEAREQEQAPVGWLDAARWSLDAIQHGATLGTLNLAVAATFGWGSSADRELGRQVTRLAVRTDAFCHMMRERRPHLALFYHNQIDSVGHRYFRYFAPKAFGDVPPEEVARLGEVIPRVYERTDAVLARIRRCSGPKANLLVVSDHGQRPAASGGRPELIVRSSHLLESLGLDATLRASNVGSRVYLHTVSPEVDIEQAAARLRGVTMEPGGEPVFDVRVQDPRAAAMRARIAGIEGYARVGAQRRPLSEILGTADRVSGAHTATAMLLMLGPDVQPKTRLPRGSLLDITPTILALQGLAPARDLPGRVLFEAFRSDSPTREPIPSVASYGERESLDAEPAILDQRTLDQLEALGYRE